MSAVNLRTCTARAAWRFLVVVLLAALSLNGAALAQTVLSFEDTDIATGTTIWTQYGPRGVIFGRPGSPSTNFLENHPAAHSGTRVLRAYRGESFDPVPVVMTFTSPQARVKLFAGVSFSPITATLKVFDANGGVVAQDGPRVIAENAFTTVFEVTVATPTVWRAELQPETVANLAIDDLEFEGEPPPPPPTTAPVVQITTPTNGADVDLELINIAGTVTGEGLLPIVTIRIEWLQPPESTAPPFTSTILLTGSGTTRQFLLEGFSGLPLGPITITAEVKNTGSLTGTGVSTITNLPIGIRNRFISEGGAAALGAFRFGLGGTCKIAVYEKAAITVDAFGVTHIARGDIFTKWFSLRTLGSGGLGCAIGDEREAFGFARAQDFTGGRIYSGVTGGPYYVPTVFVDALNKRGGEGATGLPVMDPVMPVEPVTHTWLFQRFVRPGLPDPNNPDDPDRPVISTLEIRGNPPRLWMERQSGDLSVQTTGTIWEDFPCDGNQGPCFVEPTPPPPHPIVDPGEVFCDGTTYPWGPPEWKPILGNFVNTPVFGVVRSSHMADVDNVFTHEWSYNCPLQTVRPDCPSDWLMRIRPYGPHPGTEPYGSLFAGTSRDTIKIEYERFYGEFAGWMGFPQEDDLIYCVGRWIIDCGHDTYKSEFHPIFMYAKMKTVRTVTDPFTGLVNENAFGGEPATRADIWVNGWYPGDPIEFDIFPPPRPTPTATLVVSKPVDADAAFGVNLEYTLEPADAVSHVHIRFTAPYRESRVTSAGEMIWEINRGYAGQWYLFWAP